MTSDRISPRRCFDHVVLVPDLFAEQVSAYLEESEEIDRVRQEATAEATDVRSDHLLNTYAGLMPANPRMIKRIANALGLRAVRTHVRHTEDDDAMARAAILLVRFPVLAAVQVEPPAASAASEEERPGLH